MVYEAINCALEKPVLSWQRGFTCPPYLRGHPPTAPLATSPDHLKPFKLRTALMDVHKNSYASLGLVKQGGVHRLTTIRYESGARRGGDGDRAAAGIATSLVFSWRRRARPAVASAGSRLSASISQLTLPLKRYLHATGECAPLNANHFLNGIPPAGKSSIAANCR
jgi:hypothetical protein